MPASGDARHRNADGQAAEMHKVWIQPEQKCRYGTQASQILNPKYLMA